MNCWRFGPTIFEACRSIPLSSRNELELPDAVEYSMTSLGERYRVAHSNEPVLDLSSQGDIGRVTRQLADVAVRF
jgi:dTDP-glucose pyrophosphorylase